MEKAKAGDLFDKTPEKITRSKFWPPNFRKVGECSSYFGSNNMTPSHAINGLTTIASVDGAEGHKKSRLSEVSRNRNLLNLRRGIGMTMTKIALVILTVK